MYANTRKCYFHKTEMDFLGFIVDKNGLRMDPSQVEAISEWRNYPPKTYYDIQVFLGFCNFYRRFIYNFADIARVTSQMRSDHSDRVRRMANRNYGGNGGRVLIMAAMAAAQLN